MKFYQITYFSKIRALLVSVGLLFSILILGYLFLSRVPSTALTGRAHLLLIDHSLSMTVEDVGDTTRGKRESRLDFTKKNLLSAFDGNTPIGIILYAKNPTLYAPIEALGSHFEKYIESIIAETENGGSDLATALIFAKNLYGERELSVSIYTDGGNTSEIGLPEVPKNWNITLYGIGSPSGGKIPLGYTANGERRYKYFSGSEVIVPYDADHMKSLAGTLGARLYSLDPKSHTLHRAFSPHIPSHQLFLLAIILLFLGSIISPYGRKKIHP